MAKNEKSTTVRSVFKSGESTIAVREFTNKWIELINTIEKAKVMPMSRKSDYGDRLWHKEIEN